jgi:hypothetical protein
MNERTNGSVSRFAKVSIVFATWLNPECRGLAKPRLPSSSENSVNRAPRAGTAVALDYRSFSLDIKCNNPKN